MAERPAEDRTDRPYMLMRVSLNTEQREVTYCAPNLSDSSAAKIMAAEREGATCLIHSVHTKEICEHVTEHRAIVNALNDRRDTAVHYVIEAACPESLETLLRHGGHVNITGCATVPVQREHMWFLRCVRTNQQISTLRREVIDRSFC